MSAQSSEPDITRWEILTAAVEKFAAVPRIGVLLDHDGTLAPFVDDPSQARMSQRAAGLIRTLTECRDVVTGVISGRERAVLAGLIDAVDETLSQRLFLVGSHGGEHPGLKVALTAEQEQLLDTLTQRLEALAAKYPGAWVEYKPYGRVLATRPCAAEVKAAALEDAAETIATIPGLQSLSNNDAYEFAVVQHTKGDAVRAIKKDFRLDAVLFIGDDLTDEDAFAVLGEKDLGIKVRKGPTAADYIVASIAAVEDLIAQVVELRCPGRNASAAQ